MAGLPEAEAMLLAIVFEETGAHQYKLRRESAADGQQTDPTTKRHGGLEPGFEEVFSFGEDDPNDYWHFKDNGVEIID